jgi:hypothetical protein
MTTCVNLKERFSRRWRIANEASHEAEYGENARTVDPWLMTVPCQHGHLFPWGGNLLAASTDKRGGVARKLLALDRTQVRQDGDDGVTVSFHVDDVKVVAKMMKPRTRRRLSPEHKAKLAAASARYRFPAASETPNRGLKTTISPQSVSEAT